MEKRLVILTAVVLVLLSVAPLSADTLNLKQQSENELGRSGYPEAQALVPRSPTSPFAVETAAPSSLTHRPALIAYDDDSADGRLSPGYPQARVFETPDTGKWYVVAVWVHGARVGPTDSSQSLLDLALCDDSLRPISVWHGYRSAFLAAGGGWIRLKVPPTRVPRELAIRVDFHEKAGEGVYLSFDGSTRGHSYVTVPGQASFSLQSGDWMIRVELDQPAARPGEEGQGLENRETVLDRKVHIADSLILKIPEVTRLCDGIRLQKLHVDVGGCTLYCEREGTPIVLLHGGPGATHHYFHPYFSAASKFAEVIYYDQRGCGLSNYKPGKGYTLDQAVDDLDSLRSALRIDKWVVLGHSYGGTLAQCYALKYPERVAGLVLVGSAFAGLPVKTAGTRQYDYMTGEEMRKVQGIYQNESLSLVQKLFNAHLNGDWKRQNFYRPSTEQLARMARYEWQQDPEFRNSIGQSMNSLDFSTMFDQCPLPILIMEGKWDLTWEDNKPQMLHSCFPNSSLVVFDSAGHSPFADQPKKFFDVLKAFIDTLPNVPEARISLWKSRVAKLRQELEASPAYLLKTTGYGRSASREIAAAYTREWLAELNDPSLLLKAGFALYDGEKYNEALEVFKNLAAKTQGDSFLLSMALIWQGHMLDLLGRRDEAVLVYKRVVQMNITRRQTYSQYGLTFLPSAYAQDRLAAPFSRIENQDE